MIGTSQQFAVLPVATSRVLRDAVQYLLAVLQIAQLPLQVLQTLFGCHLASYLKVCPRICPLLSHRRNVCRGMGALMTGRLKRIIESDRAKYNHLETVTETPEFTGQVIWALWKDPELMQMSGQTVIGAEMAVKYGIKDQGNRQPRSYRETHQVAPRTQYPNIIR
jgi:hypothetical protein